MIDYKHIETIVRIAGTMMKNNISESQIQTKGYANFVTDKDMEVQQFLYEKLQESCPEIGFIGEEQSEYEQITGTMHWIVDPIDGTTNYIYGYNMSAISLALKEKEEIIFGIVYNPFTNELFRAEKGKGAYLNDKKIKVSDKTSLYHSLVAVGTSPYHKNMVKMIFEKIRTVYERCLDIRRTGSAALDLAYVACGRLDAYFEYCLKPWDFASGYLLVTEAGGFVKNTEGQQLIHGRGQSVLAGCSESLINEMVEVLK